MCFFRRARRPKSASIVELPQELIERIIDELSLLIDSRKELITALSTARSFRTRARQHLFQTIDLNSDSHMLKFNELCNASPSIVGIVRTIRIALCPTSHSALRALQTHSFPNLSALQVHGWKPLPDGRLRIYLSQLWDDALDDFSNNLTSLSIHCLSFPSVDRFRSCIQAYPRLESLSLWTVAIRDTAPVEVARICPEPPIQSLSLTANIKTCALFAGPRRVFGLHILRALEIHLSLLDPEVLAFQGILDATRITLQELHLIAIGLCREPQTILDISGIPVISFQPPEETSQTAAMKYLVRCLQKSTSNPTHLTIYLAIYGREFEELDSQDIWTFIDSMSRTFVRLSFRLSEDNKDRALKNTALLLPQLHSTGRVEVQFES
ncbi:hypothetical protein EV421DRAFT_810297 [Armillaria borealis]|uniref:F-box domain-containing protein n=1 Tax=Armillaria borealis TaxID=47425 RepID=A0AA39JDP3_9AGAR|nr:hypothetical protein EV421DRAFT_810297 [Armillaria borealis]